MSPQAITSELSTIPTAIGAGIASYMFYKMKDGTLRILLIWFFAMLSLRFTEFAIFIWMEDKKILVPEVIHLVRMFSNTPVLVFMIALIVHIYKTSKRKDNNL